MTGNDESDLSRRAFLTMSWRRDGPVAPSDPSRAATTDNLVLLGTIASLRDLAVGEVVASPHRADIYAVRTATGVLAVRSRCPNDDALIAWREDEQSEDSLATLGRFYCSRDASIFNRLGELIAGPAGGPLPTLVIAERDGSLWADEAKPESPENEERLRREFALS